MAPIDLNLLRAFAAVYDAGTFSGAAQRLGVPRSTTAEGRALYDRAAPSLASLQAALSEVPRQHEAPSGTLRITAAARLGPHRAEDRGDRHAPLRFTQLPRSPRHAEDSEELSPSPARVTPLSRPRGS